MTFDRFFDTRRFESEDWFDLAKIVVCTLTGVSMVWHHLPGLPEAFVQLGQGMTQIAGGLAGFGVPVWASWIGATALMGFAFVLAALKVLWAIAAAPWVAFTAPAVALDYIQPGWVALAVLFGLVAATEVFYRRWYRNHPDAVNLRKSDRRQVYWQAMGTRRPRK